MKVKENKYTQTRVPNGRRVGIYIIPYNCATSTVLGSFNYFIARHLPPFTYLNHTFLLGKGTGSNIYGLQVLTFHDEGHFDLSPLCWPPPEMNVEALAVNPTTSIIAVGCGDGRIILIDISKVFFP
jgi:hypothetical protein